MRDISARELKGHNILAVERFQDNTRWMIEFSILRPCSYGSPGDEMRLFLTEDGYQAALVSQKRREIKIKRYARVIEGHVPVSYTHLPGVAQLVARLLWERFSVYPR